VAGDNARFDYEPVALATDGPTQLVLVQTTSELVGGDDTIFGDTDADVLIGGTEGDTIHGGDERRRAG
jgi:Ca2+-binding RTX toxin-like protein